MTTLYNMTEEGGIEFKSERKAWGVDIPAYVYDIWMPLLGSDVIGVLGVYYRLDRENGIYGKSTKLKTLAQKCRKGVDTLNKINETLAACGFIRIEKPQGADKLKHFTTKIITLDPPTSVTPEDIEKYRPRRPDGTPTEWEYEPLTTWLVDLEQIVSKTQTGLSEDPDRVLREPQTGLSEDPDRVAKNDPSVYDPSVNDPSVINSLIGVPADGGSLRL